MTRMPCSITDGPASEMDAIEEARAPQEREYDKYRDSTEEDYADLRAELVAITRLASITSRIEDLTKELQGLSWARPQAGEK